MSWSPLALFRRLFPTQKRPNVGKPRSRLRGVGLDPKMDHSEGDTVSRYPPWDKGIPMRSVDAIIAAQRDRIDRVYRTAGVAPQTFDELYMPVIENVASYIHLLPATSDSYYRGTGGLFRFAIDMGLNTLQSAQAAVFPVGGGIERRHAMLPKWALASFIAGMCCQAYRTINAMVVITADGRQWAPLLEGLYPWAVAEEVDTYFVRWIDDVQVGGAQASAAYILGRVVPAEILSWLAEDNNVVVPTMTAAVTGVESYVSENPITRLVAPMVTRVIEEDLRQMAINYGHLVIGSHLEPYLLDAMRQLIRQGKWSVNSTMMPMVWVGREGTFVHWQTAARDMASLLTRQSFTGIPRDPETLADLLIKAGITEPKSSSERYWTILLPNMEALDGMLKLKTRNQIFPPGYNLEQFDGVVLTTQAAAGAVKVAASLATDPSPAPVEAQGEKSKAPPKANRIKSEKSKIEPGSQPSAERGAPIGNLDDMGATPKTTRAGKVQQKAPDAIDGAEGGKAARVDAGQNQHSLFEADEPPPITEVPDSYAAAEGVIAAEVPRAKPNVPEKSSATAERNLNATSAASMLASLSEQSAFLLGEILRNYQSKTNTGTVQILPNGFGIDHRELTAYGIAPGELINELTNKHWLYKDLNRPSKRLHAVEVDGSTGQYLIIKPDVATALGVAMGEG